MKKFLIKASIIRIMIATGAIILTAVYFALLLNFTVISYLENKKSIFLEPGYAFADFREDLKGIPIAGFITNKEMTSENNDGKFLEAQYILAPTVLDLNNTGHDYLIFDEYLYIDALTHLHESNARLIRANPHGKILGRKK